MVLQKPRAIYKITRRQFNKTLTPFVIVFVRKQAIWIHRYRRGTLCHTHFQHRKHESYTSHVIHHAKMSLGELVRSRAANISANPHEQAVFHKDDNRR